MPYLYDADLEDPLKEDNDDHISQKQLLKIPNQIVILSDVCLFFFFFFFLLLFSKRVSLINI